MGLQNLRAKLKEKLESVTGMGQVHDYERWTTRKEEYQAKFKASGVINAWWINWEEADADPTDIANTITRTHRFRLHGIYSLKDSTASQKTFDLLTEKVLNEMSEDRSLGGVGQVAQPAQLVSNTEEMFGDVLCHVCDVDVFVSELC